MPLESAPGSSTPSLLTLLALLPLSRSPRNPSVTGRQCGVSRPALGVQGQRRREVSLLRDRVLPGLLPGCSDTQGIQDHVMKSLFANCLLILIIFARTKAPAKSCVSTVQRSSKRKAKVLTKVPAKTYSYIRMQSFAPRLKNATYLAILSRNFVTSKATCTRKRLGSVS